MTHTLWILWALLIFAAGENTPCPEGSQVHLSSLRCYWLSRTTSSFPEAQDSCKEVHGGDLAAANSLELQNFLHHSFPVKTTVWVWMKTSRGERSDQTGGLEPSSHAEWAGPSDSGGGCTVMALGTLGRWRRAQCAGHFHFLCENLITGVLLTTDSYLTGLVLMSGVFTQTQIRPLLSAPDTGRDAVELLLFPGLWFSHAGQLVTVELVVRPSPLASLARVQILRPYCDPNLHLVPPGCSSLLNPFSCCTAMPLCNTTGGCSAGWYWCHLLDTCVPTNSPCSPYDSAAAARGFESPPRYLETPPFYHMVADLPLEVKPSSELKTTKLLLPDQAIMVYPDDIVAVQHTRSSGAFLHCLKSEASINSPWRQSYLSLMGAEREGWWKPGLTSLPQKGQWVDGVVCDLRMLYVDNLQRGTEQEDVSGLTHTEATTAPHISLMTAGPSLSLSSKFGLSVIHPLPDAKRQIDIQINLPTRIVVAASSGEGATSSWSAPVMQTGVPFLPSCPSEVISSWPDYERQSREAWFSSVTLSLPSVGVQTMNVTVMDDVSSESLTVTICGYEAVAGLSVEPHRHTRMLVNISQVFVAQLETGSSAKFRWVTDDLEGSAHEGETYRALFQKPAEHRLKVTAWNPVSSQSQQLLLTVDDATPLAEPEFVSVSEVVAVNATRCYRLRVEADTSMPVTFSWDFGDDRGKVTSSHPAPGQTVAGLMEGTITQAYVQDSVNYTYSIPGDYTLHVQVVTEYDSTEASVKINVRPLLGHVQISSSPPVPVAEQAVLLEASSEPSADSVLYTWDFGDGSQRMNHTDRSVSHVYRSPGNYTAHVTASNAVSEVDRSLTVEVYERLDGLQIRCQGLTNAKYLPTREELRFIASIAKGSGVSYRWLAVQSGVNQQTTGDGDLFHLLAKTPGEISVQLIASNKLGEATAAVTVTAVERVTSAQITARSNAVALGKLVQISASASVGSDLEYLWYVNADSSPLTTQAPVLIHTFTSLGICLVTVSVRNVLSQSNDTERFTVQQEVEEVDFKIKGETRPFYVSSGAAVLLCGVFGKGSDLRWDWTVLDPKSSVFNATNQTILHSFPHSGAYQVSLNVSNDISWQVVSHRVVAQDRVEGLRLNISKSLLCAEEEVTFVPTISRGSNASFTMTVRREDWIHSQSSVEGKYTTSNLPVGSNVITVRAWNQVSSEELSTDVLVIEHVAGLRLVNRSVALEALKGAHFKAEVQRGGPVNYTWTFDTRSGPVLLTGQEVFFTPTESGSLYVSIVASNGVCSCTLNESVPVERPVKTIQLVCDAERTFLGHVVRFSTTVDGGSNLTYHWDFGEFTEVTVTESKSVSHTYRRPGEYSVMVRAVNGVSRASTQLHVKVEELRCSSPQVSLGQSQSTIFMSRPSFFEASVNITCSAFKPVYLWEVYTDSDCANGSTGASGSRTVLSGESDAASPLLSLPKNSLGVGLHCLVFTVSLQGSPLSAQRGATITVVHSPLVAAIKGGSHRLWSSLSDLILDGSDSQDPDEEPGEEESLQYRWTCVTPSSTEVQLLGQTSSKMMVLSSQLHAGAIYTFTLTVLKRGRTPTSASQTVSVTQAPALPVMVECVSCSVVSSSPLFTHTNALVMSGQCGRCGDSAQYVWRAESQTGGSLDLDDITTSTGRRSPHLVVRSGVLQPELSYTFTLNVSQPGRGQWGIASLSVLPNSPPRGGRCDLSPESDIRLLETVVTYNCSGWQDDESEASQLIYSLQVAPCHIISHECPMLLLYRGVRSAFSSVVPTGTQRQGRGGSLITVVLLVEDHLGAKVTALNRTLTVENPTRSQGAADWLKSRSQKELWALVQRGNPQEIIPYSMVLTTQLNKMQATQNVRELMDRRTIRETVTQALTSLPLSSMLDVDQISSALAQSTDVPGELVCENCHKQILRAVGEMIRLLEDQLIPGAMSAVRTGGNILNILGSTVAASSLHSSSWTSLQSASTVALSALSHAGALMRSLMRSQFRGESPLLLSNPYISTLGFRGDPSDLLCTNHLNQPRLPQKSPGNTSNNCLSCPFHIPKSLTAHLRSQRTEVVQVLIAADGAVGSVPLLTAADPQISTGVVAMEITTPQGRPVHIRDLQPEQAIRVALHHKRRVERGSGGEAGKGTCFTVALDTEQLNFTIKAPDELDENAGLYLSFNFSLAPGCTRVMLGRVKVEASSSGTEANASHNSLVREWDFALSAQSLSAERTVFLSPLLNKTDERLSVNMATLLGGDGSVRLSLCVFSSVCRYYNLQEKRWSSEGLQPLEGSTLHTVHCLTQHLTMFGASLFVHPGAVVLLQPSAGPVRSVVPGIVCAVLVLIHLLAWLIAHKLDHLDDLRQSRVPLCGRPGLYHYRVLVKTGWKRGAGTSAHVGIGLYGVNKSGSRHLQRDGAFQRGSLDQFHLETDENLGEVWKIRIWHDNTGLDPSWYLEHVVIWDAQTDHLYFFLLHDWLSVESERSGAVERQLLASCPEELSEFRRVLASQLLFGMTERHMWLSLWERPAHSFVTRGQRIICSAVILHLYLALGALWYGAVGTKGHGGPVSAHLLVNAETVAVGMTLALLAFPLQCSLGFWFRKSHSKVTADMLVSPSPDCHSVEMDIYLGQSVLSSPSFISLPDSSGPNRDTSASLLESKGIDSSILDFWATSGLAPQTQGTRDNKEADSWSCDSFFNLPLSSGHTTTTSAGDLGTASSAAGPSHPLRRKKALMELGPVAPSSRHTPSTRVPSPCRYQFFKDSSGFNKSPDAPGQQVLAVTANQVQGHKHSLATFLTLSEEDLLMSIAAASEDPADLTGSSSDSGWDSPRATSSLSTTWSMSRSSWSDRSEAKSLCAARSSLYGTGLYRCPSALSVSSVASTFLPSPSPDSARSSSSTRIGVARGPPSCLLPPWALCVACPLLAVLLGASLAVIGLYGSFFSRTVVLMWLVSALCAFLTSAVLLEPLKVCVQALIYTVVWRPVDPEVEEQLSRETTVVRAFGEHRRKVRPPCGYGLLQAKEEARKVQALRSLMRHCVCQLFFVMLVLMVNYQDSVEQSQGRLLQSSVRRCLHATSSGGNNLTSLRDWSDAEQWIGSTLVHHLHQNPSLRLVGSPRLRHTRALGAEAGLALGNSSEMTRRLLAGLHVAGWSKKMFTTLSIDFTHHHRQSGLFVCVSLQLAWNEAQALTPSLFIYPLLIPPSTSGLDLQVALMVLLLVAALLIFFAEMWSLATERAQYLRQCKHWLQLILALLSLATAVLHLSFLSLASSCVSKLLSQPDSFVSFHSAALQVQRSSQCAAVLLTVLLLKTLRTLRFVRRWVPMGRVLHRAWRELWAFAVLLPLLLLLCVHLGDALFSRSVGGFLSAREACTSVLSMLRGRNAIQSICRVHPAVGPVYGLLLIRGAFWVLARLCGAILIHTYREERVELYHPAVEPQDYEMVEFFIKRLKLWMGLTKAREFRHRVTFEGMDVPPSRSSQESRLSTASSTLHFSRSPSLYSSVSSPSSLSSVLSAAFGDPSASDSASVQPYCDRLLPCVNALLSQFDRVNQITEEVHNLEMKLEEAQTRKRRRRIINEGKSAESFKEEENLKEEEDEGRVPGEVRRRKTGVFYPRQRVSLPSCFPFNASTLHSNHIYLQTQNSYSDSDSVLPQVSNGNHGFEASAVGGSRSSCPAAPLEYGQFPRRRAWHSGTSHSADAAQRACLLQGGAVPCLALTDIRPRSEEGVKRRISDGVPVKRKAWISEGPDTQD